MIKHKGVESKEYPGYFIIPGYNNYLISESGVIISLVTTKSLKPGDELPINLSTRAPFYKRVAIYNNAGKNRVISRHLLVARVFLGSPPINKDKVIYLDNDLNNYHWSNLKYTDSSGVAKARDLRIGATQFRVYANRI